MRSQIQCGGTHLSDPLVEEGLLDAVHGEGIRGTTKARQCGQQRHQLSGAHKIQGLRGGAWGDPEVKLCIRYKIEVVRPPEKKSSWCFYSILSAKVCSWSLLLTCMVASLAEKDATIAAGKGYPQATSALKTHSTCCGSSCTSLGHTACA